MICIDRCKSRMVRLLTEYPLTFFLSQIFIHLCIVVVLVSDGDLVSETDDKDVRITSLSTNIYSTKNTNTQWLVPGSPIVQIFDAYEQAKKDVDAVTETTNLLRTFRDEESMTSITYRAVDGGTIFEPLNLQDMCTFERKFWDEDTYSSVCVLDSNSTCVPQSMSVVNLFYGDLPNCTLLSQSHVDTVVDILFDNAFNETVDEEIRLMYSLFLSQDADANTRRASKTKSLLVLGSPLRYDEDDEDEELTGYDLDGPYQVFLEAVGDGTFCFIFFYSNNHTQISN